MALLDPIITADQAREIGLVHSVVADNGLLTAARETAGRLACGPTAAFAAVKNEINSSVFAHLEEQLEIERMNFLQVLKSADAREGVAAFFENVCFEEIERISSWSVVNYCDIVRMKLCNYYTICKV